MNEGHGLLVAGRPLTILKQPALTEGPSPMAVGDEVSLECLVTAGERVRLRWLRQGFIADMTEQDKHSTLMLDEAPWKAASKPEWLVAGPTLVDHVPQSQVVTHWIYRCQVKCPDSGEEILSRPVVAEVSRSLAKGLPQSKIALIVCQTEYGEESGFHSLNAPRRDGIALTAKLEACGFEVWSLVNLDVRELKSAVEIFSSFIDRATFALFYFNGHAVGVNDDVFLLGCDSKLKPSPMAAKRVVWHRWIIDQMDSRRPMMGVAILDCCREGSEAQVNEALKMSTMERKSPVSNFVISFATRAGIRNYEGKQGLFMKHLLRFIDDRKKSFATVLDEVRRSFTKEESAVISDRMSPEYFSSSEPFCLNCPMPYPALGAAAKSLLNVTTYQLLDMGEASVTRERLVGNFAANEITFSMSLYKEDAGEYKWLESSDEDQRRVGELRLQFTPAAYANEANMRAVFRWKSGCANQDVSVQIVNSDVELEQPLPKVDNDKHSLVRSQPPAGDQHKPGQGLTLSGLDQELAARVVLKRLQKARGEAAVFLLLARRRCENNLLSNIGRLQVRLPGAVHFPKKTSH